MSITAFPLNSVLTYAFDSFIDPIHCSSVPHTHTLSVAIFSVLFCLICSFYSSLCACIYYCRSRSRSSLPSFSAVCLSSAAREQRRVRVCGWGLRICGGAACNWSVRACALVVVVVAAGVAAEYAEENKEQCVVCVCLTQRLKWQCVCVRVRVLCVLLCMCSR